MTQRCIGHLKKERERDNTTFDDLGTTGKWKAPPAEGGGIGEAALDDVREGAMDGIEEAAMGGRSFRLGLESYGLLDTRGRGLFRK
jgi:hypothetical protein